MHEPAAPAVEKRIYRFFEVGLLLKGANAVLEIVGGLLVWLVSPAFVQEIVAYFTAEELGQDSHDLIATTIRHWADVYATGPHQLFVGAYLLSHGVVKLALVVGLLKNRLWAYPASLVVFGLFIAYQAYLYFLDRSPFVAALTLFDLAVMYLIWREWRIVRSHEPASAAPAQG